RRLARPGRGAGAPRGVDGGPGRARVRAGRRRGGGGGAGGRRRRRARGARACAREACSRILGGILISAWWVVSVLAGLLYALRPWPRPLHLRLPVLVGIFGVLVAAMSAAGSSLVGLTIVMLLAGTVITPQVTAQSLALEV